MYFARFTSDRKQILKEHLISVAEYCRDFGKTINMSATAELCGYLHDIGKYNESFQKYLILAEEHRRNGDYEEWTKSIEKVDHGVFGAKYVYDKFLQKDAFENLTAEIIAEVICYHHGGLPDNIVQDKATGKTKVPLIERINKVSADTMNQVIEKFETENQRFYVDRLFEIAVQEMVAVIKKSEGKQQFWIGMLIKNLYSILVDADRWDSYVFEVNEEVIKEDDRQALWGKWIEKVEQKIQEFSCEKYETQLERTVQQVRLNISENCAMFAKKPTGIYTLTVPTGGGKTISSLRFALNHAKATEKEKIYYIIPYTTIIEQNAQEVRNTLDCKDELLEFHSNILDINKNKDYEILSERWTSPIIFTTMVQFLNAIYAKGNNNIRRLHQLENAVIIFDEIQTLPIKCMDLFYEAIYYLNCIAKSTIVLCTATQPKLDIMKERTKLKTNGEIISNISEPFEKLRRMNLIDKTEKELTITEVAKFACEVKEDKENVLVVMNTVGSAEKLLQEIKGSGLENTRLYFLSSRLCAEHRGKVIFDLKQSLKSKESLICISTQLIEAGIDISFTATIRSLAGLDSIAQTTGRGNRHGEKEKGNSYIIRVAEENISSLFEVKTGQKHMRDILFMYSKNPDKFDYDLLSPKAISMYYKGFFGDEDVKKNMSYHIKNTEGNIHALLLERRERKNRYDGIYPLLFSYQFATAGDEFSVIDNATETVIVPYGGGKELIARLLGNTDCKEKMELLKQAQKFSVTIYRNLYEQLKKENAIVKCDFDGVNILAEGFYDGKKGVTLEKKLEFCEF